MTPGLQAALAVAPILLAAVLLIGFRVPARRAMPLVYAAAAALALTAWRMDWVRVAASSLQGLIITFDILWIVFGAVLLLHTLEQSGGVAAIRRSFRSISPDPRVQVVILAWLFGSFLEGAAGFGTPAAITAPLMVALGFPPAAAVMLGMMIQSTAVTFGACGTPVLVGVRGGLGDDAFLAHLEAHGLTMDAYLQLVTVRAASLHAVAGTLMPALMVVMLTRFFGARRSWTEGTSILPFALFGGLAFTVPYWLCAALLGPEFPSLLGALVGLAVVTAAARRGFLVPADRWDFPAGGGTQGPAEHANAPPTGMSAARAFAPYLLVALLLVITRLPDLPVGAWLRSVRLQWSAILGTDIAQTTTPLYLPGSILVVAAAATTVLHRMRGAEVRRAVRDSGRVLLGAGWVLVFAVPMVRIYINSGTNGGGLPSMPIAMAEWVAAEVGPVWPAFAGVTGALGAFIAGSNTVSNLMFATFQHGVAERLAVSSSMVVALQAVGAAAGNMVAIHNVVAASATVGWLGREGETLRRTVLPTLYYLAVIGALGLVAVAALPAHAAPPHGALPR